MFFRASSTGKKEKNFVIEDYRKWKALKLLFTLVVFEITQQRLQDESSIQQPTFFLENDSFRIVTYL